MATKVSNLKRKRPERDIDEVRAEAKPPKDGLIDKQSVLLKTDGEDSGESAPATLEPTDEQLEKINKFTRTPKSAEEVVVIPTLACNDIVDRDYDRFTTDTINGFTALPEPYSPIGKSFMVGHDYTKLPVGRLFDQATEEIDGNNHLKLWAYIPKTTQNEEFITNIDFGVYWAVSVGVVLEQSQCQVGDPHDWGWWGGWCTEGHEKGLYYDPKSEETDSWGFPLPVEPDAKNAQLCFRDLEQPKDFYELSQVYLGAQYFAQLAEKDPMKSIVKAASAGKISPLVGLSETEAKAIDFPFPTTDKMLRAMKDHKVLVDDDGTLTWTDPDGLVWMFDPERKNPLSLGKASILPEDPKPEETETEKPEETKETPKEKSEVDMSKQSLILAAAKASLPASLISKLEELGEDSILENFLKEVATKLNESETKISELSSKAVLGEEYVKELKTDVIHYYRLSVIDPTKEPSEKEGVDVSHVEKLLALAGSDIGVIRGLREDYKKQAQGKFPESIRRSTIDKDPNEPEPREPVGQKEQEEADNAHRVRRLHGS